MLLRIPPDGVLDLFIALEKCIGKWAEDSKANCIIATAYFELLCNAHGSGASRQGESKTIESVCTIPGSTT